MLWHPPLSFERIMSDFEIQLLSELRAIREAMQKIANTQSVTPSATISAPYVAVQPSPTHTPTAHPAVQPHAPQPVSNITNYYFGTPDGQGFDECNAMLDPNNPRILYVIEASGNQGRFYPLSRGFSRLKSNANSFLLPLCNLTTPLDELQSLDISPDKYGEVELKDGFWTVTKKCNI